MKSVVTESPNVSPPVLPEVKGLPYIGVAHQMLLDPLAFQEKLVAKHGRIQRIQMGGGSLLLLHDAKLIDEVLRRKGKLFPKAPMGMEAVEPLLGEGVAAIVDMERWQFAHNMVMPLFTPKALARYWDGTVPVVLEEVERIAQLAATGETFDLYKQMHEAMFRILMRTLFSGDFEEREITEMVHLFDAQTAYISARYLTNSTKLPLLIPAARHGKKALEELDRRVGGMIEKRQQNRADTPKDMLDLMLAARHEDGSELTFKELRDNCMTMLFGGHETTAGSLTWAFGLLAANPEKRDVMFSEIDHVLSDKNWHYHKGIEILKEFEYTGMVFDEAMRLYPMFPFLFRVASAETDIGGHAVTTGDTIAFSAWTTHRDPEYWPDPEAFEPERHTNELKKKRLSASFLPFSQGLRRCIGERVARMEAYLLIGMISREYKLELVDERLPKPKVSMSIKPKGGMKVRATARKTRSQI